ncbi:uncharacterized protein PgNI_12136 [Pyricularia grisea]|uniref:Uncharacterized protein n=1 Tax=Pyricularia grisea TaxID=148305 RepID=A0A6P8AQ91_PYRGI|nr:uncharacterized protein PgNI_12136 [Pyricularia grisea]TLD04222.1 hypothetical protein PgNI_12136 [Pyricularia grisea]
MAHISRMYPELHQSILQVVPENMTIMWDFLRATTGDALAKGSQARQWVCGSGSSAAGATILQFTTKGAICMVGSAS